MLLATFLAVKREAWMGCYCEGDFGVEEVLSFDAEEGDEGAENGEI
jgi:hypothetical protein